MATYRIIVKLGGGIQFIYDDRLRALLSIGHAKLRRASHVEPTPDNQFTADMAPVNGPVLGPFEEHRLAIQAEREWLDAHTDAWA